MSDKNRTGSTTGFTIRPMREEDLQIVGEMTATTFTPYEDPNSPYLDILRDVTPRFQNAMPILLLLMMSPIRFWVLLHWQQVVILGHQLRKRGKLNYVHSL